MTRGEYDAKPIKAGPATISHKFLIERAMAKGKTIPAEVLADYPKLAEKVNQKAPESPKTIPDLQEALQAGKITKAEFDKQVEEIRSVQPKDKFIENEQAQTLNIRGKEWKPTGKVNEKKRTETKKSNFTFDKIDMTVKFAKELRTSEDKTIIENQKRLGLPSEVNVPLSDCNR